jgi:hypothetical protein
VADLVEEPPHLSCSSSARRSACAQELAAAEGLDRVTRELAEEAAQVPGRQGGVPRSQELRTELCRQVLALRAARAPAAPAVAAAAPHDWLRGCRRAWDAALRSRGASALLARMQAGRYLHAGGWRASAA